VVVSSFLSILPVSAYAMVFSPEATFFDISSRNSGVSVSRTWIQTSISLNFRLPKQFKCGHIRSYLHSVYCDFMMGWSCSFELLSCSSCYSFFVGRDCVVRAVTRYGLDVSGIESWWGWHIPLSYRPSLAPARPPAQWVLGLLPGHKAAGASFWSPTTF